MIAYAVSHDKPKETDISYEKHSKVYISYEKS